ncbi:MAG TPA: hypothetical protein VMT38_02435 [Terracidiphilus sp.]|nr:hypothetical protein [Terracidiphilus sp.]
MPKRSVVFVPAILLLLIFESIALHIGLRAQQQTPQPAPPADALTSFTVKITYSQKAMDTLVASKETVIVAGYLTASPIPGTPKKYVDHVGEIGMGTVHKEIAPGEIATFAGVEPTPAMTKWVDSSGPQLLINVYSGRKSSPNNLLDCGIYEGSLKAAQGKTIPIACKLIGE